MDGFKSENEVQLRLNLNLKRTPSRGYLRLGVDVASNADCTVLIVVRLENDEVDGDPIVLSESSICVH